MRLTKENYEFFKIRCAHWVKFWGISEWKIAYRFNEELAEEGNYAQITSSHRGRIATISIAAEMPDHVNESNIEQIIDSSAFHEISHLLLHELQFLGGCRWVQENELEVAGESLVRRMENAILRHDPVDASPYREKAVNK
jgi:hypothetical protein